MAIIKCPECGGNVSTTAKQCIHCGCNITVCPECGTPIIGESKVCLECGWQVQGGKIKTEAIREEEAPREETISNLFNTWKKGSILRNISLGKGEWVSFLLFIVMCFISINMLSTWENGAPLGRVFEAESVHTGTCTVFLIGFILFVGITEIYAGMHSYYLPRNFGDWAKRKGIDIKQKIMEYLESDFRGMTKEEIEQYTNDTATAIQVEIFQENEPFQLQKRNEIIKDCVTLVGEVIIWSLWIIRGIESYMEYVISPMNEGGFFGYFSNVIFSLSENSFWVQNKWLVIFSIVFAIILSVINGFFRRAINKSVDKWCKENFPTHYHVYEKRIKNKDQFLSNL